MQCKIHSHAPILGEGCIRPCIFIHIPMRASLVESAQFFFRPRSQYNATPKFYGAAYEDVTVSVAGGTPEAGSLRGW
jgi:hypothetical protein